MVFIVLDHSRTSPIFIRHQISSRHQKDNVYTYTKAGPWQILSVRRHLTVIHCKTYPPLLAPPPKYMISCIYKYQRSDETCTPLDILNALPTPSNGGSHHYGALTSYGICHSNNYRPKESLPLTTLFGPIVTPPPMQQKSLSQYTCSQYVGQTRSTCNYDYKISSLKPCDFFNIIYISFGDFSQKSFPFLLHFSGQLDSKLLPVPDNHCSYVTF